MCPSVHLAVDMQQCHRPPLTRFVDECFAEGVPHVPWVVRLEGGLASHTGWQIARQWQQSVPWEMKRIKVKELLNPFVYMISDAGCKVLCVAIHDGQELVGHINLIVHDSDGV